MNIHLVAGFLGCGKTTAISQACKVLSRDGIRAAVITNDQGDYLVDSELFHSLGVPYGEVTGGCFCCNFNELASQADRLRNEGASVIFAESVGSCTDLVATVLKPLLKDNSIPIEQLTFSTLVDARLLLTYSKKEKLPFGDDTNYIWQKQIEESEILIVNKTDLIDASDIKFLESYVRKNFPEKTLLFQHSLDAASIKQWLEFLGGYSQGVHKSLEINYDRYAAGEASLAWLDESLDIRTPDESAPQIAKEFISAFADAISSRKIPVGHLKFIVRINDKTHKFSFTSIEDFMHLRNDFAGRSGHASIVVNARIQTSPDMLRRMVAQLLTHFRLRYNVDITEHKVSFFSPGYPRPTHRLI